MIVVTNRSPASALAQRNGSALGQMKAPLTLPFDLLCCARRFKGRARRATWLTPTFDRPEPRAPKVERVRRAALLSFERAD